MSDISSIIVLAAVEQPALLREQFGTVCIPPVETGRQCCVSIGGWGREG